MLKWMIFFDEIFQLSPPTTRDEFVSRVTENIRTAKRALSQTRTENTLEHYTHIIIPLAPTPPYRRFVKINALSLHRVPSPPQNEQLLLYQSQGVKTSILDFWFSGSPGFLIFILRIGFRQLTMNK